MSDKPNRLLPRKGDYGFDAPYVPIGLGLGSAALVVVALLSASQGAIFGAVIAALGGLWLLLSTASYIYTTRAGKFAVWAELLRSLHLQGDEQVLDLGCGRGAVLLMAAQLAPEGKAVGLDLWKTSDQSGNRAESTRRNAEQEGVAERVELNTGDMRSLPFGDGAFDLVVSSLAIHNIGAAEGRAAAIDEAIRVLRPGGRLLIADIQATGVYQAHLVQRGMLDINVRSLGWRFWYGGPWMAARLVSARKPG